MKLPDSPRARCLSWAYLAAGLVSSTIYVGTFLYCWWNAPWTQFRHASPTRQWWFEGRLWQHVGGLFSLIVMVLALAGGWILASKREMREYPAIWATLFVLLLALAVCGVPGL